MNDGDNEMEKRSIPYAIVSRVLTLVIDVFFKEITVRGAHKIPRNGPVLFCIAPHHNQFVDPILVMRTTHRPVSFLTAQKTLYRKFVGTLARAIGVIAVTRPEDVAVKKSGLVKIDENDNTILIGIDTKFKTDFTESMSIMLVPNQPGANKTKGYVFEPLVIEKIIDDTQLKLKQPLESANELDWPLLYKAVPKIDQKEVYNRVWDALNENRVVGIFPEGGSHDQTELRKFKAGAPIMALGAMAEYGHLKVQIVPVGLHYFHAHRFRSRANISFGDPISVDPKLVEDYRAGGAEKREAISSLLISIFTALKGLSVSVEDHETLHVIQAFRRLYIPTSARLSVGESLDFTIKFAKAYADFKTDPVMGPKLEQLRKNVLKYNERLNYFGMRDHEVDETYVLSKRKFETTLSSLNAAVLLLYRLALLMLFLTAALPGFVVNLPMGIVINVQAKKKAAEALKASTVKLRAYDVLATWKLLFGFVILPIYYLIIAAIVGFFKNSIQTGVLTFLLLPVMSYVCVRLGEQGIDIFRSIKPLSHSVLIPGEGIKMLRGMRSALRKQIVGLVKEWGPTVIPDYDDGEENQVETFYDNLNPYTPITRLNSTSSTTSPMVPGSLQRRKTLPPRNESITWEDVSQEPFETIMH